ncbi:nucleotidyl transferase AbiEii/AbiGii toxin family protein [Actinoplanes sp. RD1]|uniref:nucleotidyl transferase AbiEii/AbiGii toxin family protein n=1 Tax=Actinoplanes sp. RD1 TaxID=3064538 RepID=UPI002741BE49|nr:nucleotidyl transferase AbiEii/AbiGii toxin family protein [Actinoplanes sp. RD1]
MEISGDFEAHLTVHSHKAGQLAAFAEEHGLAWVHIRLDRGSWSSQPMLTLTGSGTLDEMRALVAGWAGRLNAAGLETLRTKIEATPWATGVPATDEQAAAAPDRYFEHHVKLLLPEGATSLAAVGEVADRHHARMSRNARSRPRPGTQTRFVNQRCYDAGRATATEHLDRLVADLRAGGHEILSVEQEYVVEDSRIILDASWLSRDTFASDRPVEEWDTRRTEVPTLRRGFPPTYRPLPRTAQVSQRGVFDPALRNYAAGYTTAEPVFADPAAARRWTAARTEALHHALAAIARSPWADHLVLRGSLTLAAWLGEAARAPKDLDFVVVAPSPPSDLLDGVVAALTDLPGAGLRPDEAVRTAIWTYERADGQRLVIPVAVEGGSDTAVQIDFVFGEKLPAPPRPLILPGADRPVPAATAPQSLAWKLRWLADDQFPQGKDLYDAVLLAEHVLTDPELTAEFRSPELAADARALDPVALLDDLTELDIDWPNFQEDYHTVEGTCDQWTRRLAVALETLHRG